jgi:hypothetical protein
MLLAAECVDRKTQTMKKFYILVVTIAMMLVVNGCGTTPKKIAYKTLAAVGASVNTASNALVDGKIAGKITDAEWQHANNVHTDFLRVYTEACNAAGLDTYAPADVIRLELEFLNLVNSFLK